MRQRLSQRLAKADNDTATLIKQMRWAHNPFSKFAQLEPRMCHKTGRYEVQQISGHEHKPTLQISSEAKKMTKILPRTLTRLVHESGQTFQKSPARGLSISCTEGCLHVRTKQHGALLHPSNYTPSMHSSGCIVYISIRCGVIYSFGG